MEKIAPLEKPSRIFHDVCAYWPTSSVGSSPYAPGPHASSMPASKMLSWTVRKPATAGRRAAYRPCPWGFPIGPKCYSHLSERRDHLHPSFEAWRGDPFESH